MIFKHCEPCPLQTDNRAVSVQLFQIMLDVANEIGHFYRHAATQ